MKDYKEGALSCGTDSQFQSPVHALISTCCNEFESVNEGSLLMCII